MYSSPETFTLFDYNVSLQRLLLRASHDGPEHKNIDIVFSGVEYMQIPPLFRGLDIERVTNLKALPYHKDNLQLHELTHIYALKSRNAYYFICSLSLHIQYNNLEFNESSLRVLKDGYKDVLTM